MITRPSVSASLTTFVEFYRRSNVRLASAIGMLLILSGVSLAVGLAHPPVGVVAALTFGATGFAVPQLKSILNRENPPRCG